jgi:hypothetical protein
MNEKYGSGLKQDLIPDSNPGFLNFLRNPDLMVWLLIRISNRFKSGFNIKL